MQVFKKFLENVKRNKFLGLLKYTKTFFLTKNVPSYPQELQLENFKNIKKILVLAPHPDDETFGMGGIIFGFIQLGISVDIVWFSNAENEIRVQESEKVMQYLKMPYTTKTSFPFSGDILDVTSCAEHIESLLSSNNYDMVCIPSFCETHHDHVTLYQAAYRTVKKKISDLTDLRVLQYEVWNTLLPNYIYDISHVVQQKKDMMDFYQSQLEAQRDYIGKILGLNKYRGLTYSHDYAEAFIVLSANDFLTINHD